VVLELPTNCNGSLVLAVNAKTSVAGFVQIGVTAANVTAANVMASVRKPSSSLAMPVATAPYTRYALCNSDPLRGNFLAATASWGGGSVRTLTDGSARVQAVRLEVVLVAAKLFSLQFQCLAEP
jgi:hypothetical protein